MKNNPARIKPLDLQAVTMIHVEEVMSKANAEYVGETLNKFTV